MATQSTRSDVVFDSWGERCAAWLYRPAGPEGSGAPAGDRLPCVVMAHGWAGTREARLDAFAERFAAAGLVVLVFDYRHFGASEGEPRQLLDIRRQLEDWAAAISYARALSDVDPERIALWGTSFSGGHVIETAARDRRLAAIVASVPFVDGLANLARLGRRHAARLTLLGLRDQVAALRGRPPVMLPAVGPPGSTATMNTPDAEPGYKRLIPPGSNWRNETAARVALRVGTYRPVARASSITCPALFTIAEDDAITPPDLALRACAAVPHSELRRYPGGHFDLYVPPQFDQVVADQSDFLVRVLA